MAMEDLFAYCEKKLKAMSDLDCNGQCLKWTGCVNKQGYGQFRYRDPRSEGYKTRSAHRVTMMVKLKDFDLDPSIQASHLCHNSLCINTDHISLESNKVNNLRKLCVLCCRCNGHVDENGKFLADCLLALKK